MSTIDNYAKGDAIQIMVSTNGKTIHGRNQGFGCKTRQVGGYMSDMSLQRLFQSLFYADNQKDEQAMSHRMFNNLDQSQEQRCAELTPMSIPCSTSSLQ